jgi:putative restriction endonuclease
LNSNVRLKTIAALQDAVSDAYLDEELFRFCCDGDARNSLLGVLVSKWFPDKAQQIARLFKIQSFQALLNSYKESGGKTYRSEVLEDEGNLLVRDAAFRRTITTIYDNRCAVCEIKAIDHLGRPIVDGAHIKPFSKFYDDKIDNGISLCKNHHWAFDRGWFAVDDNYCLLVTRNLFEEVPGGKPLAKYAGHPILIPENDIYCPRQDAIRWHRENVFTGD